MPVVFVHGVPTTHRLWNPICSHLKRKDVVTLSLPGFDSPVPEGFSATKEAYASWLLQELEALDGPIDLVAHDWGWMLAQRAVSLKGDLIRPWAGGSGPVDVEYTWHEFAQRWQTPGVGEQVMEELTPEIATEILVKEGVPRDTAQETIHFFNATMKGCILSLYRSAVNVGADWQPDVDKIEKRPLIFWGKNDSFVSPDFGRRLADRLHGELVVFNNCGHWWPLQRPAEAAAALE